MRAPPYWSFPECNIPAPFILSFKDVMHEREISSQYLKLTHIICIKLIVL